MIQFSWCEGKGGGKLWISRWRGVGDALHCIGVVKIVVIVFSPFMPWLPHKLSQLSSIRERACICVNAALDKCRHSHRYVIIFVVLPLSSTPSVPSLLSSSSSTSSSSSLLSLSFYGQVGHDHVSYSFKFVFSTFGRTCLQVGWLVCLLTGFWLIRLYQRQTQTNGHTSRDRN